MGYFDLGGGLAIDYDGSQTNYMHSKNYSLDEYTFDIIEVVMSVLDDAEVSHPTIITESGRSTVAYYSVLLVNILDIAQFDPQATPQMELPETTPDQIVNLLQISKDLTVKNVQECFNDAGVIYQYIDLHDEKKTLQLHNLKKDEEYYLGFFLVGAYQETLGDLHNLFGDTNVVSIRLEEGNTYSIVREIEGDTIADVLSYVEYDPKHLLSLFRKKAEQAVKENKITVKERLLMVNNFEESLRGYTYYEK
jgi:arginine decarboxylase-like protein